MITCRDDIQIPGIVTNEKDNCSIYIPDFKITIHGSDFVEALANAVLSASAIYYYNLDRNLRLKLDTTYQDADAMCTKNNQFATFVTLTA